jgi:hypothetical protein
MAKRVKVTNEGVTTVDEPDPIKSVAEIAGDANLSPALQRLQRLRDEAAAQRQGLPVPERIESRIYNGETWYFLRLDYAGLAEVKLRASQEIANGFKAYWRAISKAELLGAVVKGLDDATPYFSEADIDAWLNEPAGSEIYELIDWLVGNALELNPLQKKVTTTTSSPLAPESGGTEPSETPSGGDASKSPENSEVTLSTAPMS